MTDPIHSGPNERPRERLGERAVATSTSTSARTLAIACVLAFAFAISTPREAHASLLSEEAEDTLATFIALFVLFIVPVVLIVLFWMVHVLPEKIAHKRHHPQFEAIRTLCLLSLVFGGLLWPIAWIWAYSKPVMYKMAYGTDKVPHGAYAGTETDADGHAQPAAEPEVASLHDRVARLEDRVPAAELTTLRADLDALEAKFVQGAR
jgi:CBS domain containing-hemolysin-like protein